MAAALDADRDAELHRALDAVVDIAIDRHAKLSASMIELAANRYGKAAIRIVRVGRDTTPHALRDLTVAVALEGDFAAAHTDGDNSMVVATDTMKNTAYAFAADHLTGAIEPYATALGRHFLERGPGRPGDRQRPRARLAADRRRRQRRRPTRSSAAARAPASRRSPSDGTRSWSRPASRTWSS